MLLGIHSLTLPSVCNAWVLNKFSFDLFLITEIEADKSEFIEEPGTMILLG